MADIPPHDYETPLEGHLFRPLDETAFAGGKGDQNRLTSVVEK